jgi:hypothetical protein
MRWLKTIVAEVFGLFVDDGSFALAILVWLGVVWAGVSRLRMPSVWHGVVLFAGLTAILAASAWRGARR